MRKGLTSWVIHAGKLTLAYRWNMGIQEAMRTFKVKKGQNKIVACGPLLIEW